MKRITCQYCGKEAKKTHTEYGVRFECFPCQAWVGTHKSSGNPLGTLANAKLRASRMLAHEVFDYLWQTKIYDRRACYSALAELMHITESKCHIAMFNEFHCDSVLLLMSYGIVEDLLQEEIEEDKKAYLEFCASVDHRCDGDPFDIFESTGDN